MVKQKIVLKLQADDERKRRKAFKAAVGIAGVTSATMEGDKMIIVGDGIDPISLTTMLRRRLGHAELLSVSSGDDKKKDGYGAAYGAEKKKDGSGGGGGGYHQNAVAPIPCPAYQQQYNAMPSYPAYSCPPYQREEQDPGCSIM
ncbi:uncharacterized protein LOC100824539 isoform X2 [Brachypodium distachyon]|uniref:uncharacterized protein LOC100824539 isoform X2 n=1 Tax=Brachypodium distachyon TaxID=15368 RepID=UPI0001C70DDD|nr:uncharacterized protein LOC100824539 isoform X2 [Brachypodium distachyon]|eukprot:XP_003577912.1 uncharacterized protein LOC100824539 isoform X2 [Brachypodium distachyon]